MRYAERKYKTYRLALDAQRASRRVNNVIKVVIFGLSLFILVYGSMGGFAW